MKFLNEIYCKVFEVGENGLTDIIESIEVRGYTLFKINTSLYDLFSLAHNKPDKT